MPESTGDTRVDESLAMLGEVAELPLVEQVVTFETVHRALQDTLASVDES